MFSGIHIGNRPSDHINIMGDTDQPWLVKESIEFLFNRLDKTKIGFEFGSGSSTFWFSKFTNKIYSIESDKSWYNTMTNLISEKEINNIYIDILEAQMMPIFYSDLEIENEYKIYSDSILKHNFEFDYILIDGVARSLCIRNSLLSLKKGGLLIIDNAERPAYHEEMLKIPDSWIKNEFICKVDTTIIYEKPH